MFGPDTLHDMVFWVGQECMGWEDGKVGDFVGYIIHSGNRRRLACSQG